jgi:hypothetical protein
MNPQTIQLILAGVAAISNVISNSKPNNTYNNCNITTNNNYYNNDYRSFNEAALNGWTRQSSNMGDF